MKFNTWLTTCAYSVVFISKGRATASICADPLSEQAEGISDLKWEGAHLVVTKAMEPEGPTLANRLSEVDEIKIRFEAHSHKHGVEPQTRTFLIKHRGIRNRGFDFANAEIDAVACEAVLLLDAEAFEVRG